MRNESQPVYMIGVAAQLAGVHPQTLRQYERIGLVVPNRVGGKNRLYSEVDVMKVRRIQRLTQQMGVNLAGVELVLKLLDQMDDMSREFERQFVEYVQDAERRIAEATGTPTIPIRKDDSLLPTPRFEFRKRFDI